MSGHTPGPWELTPEGWIQKRYLNGLYPLAEPVRAMGGRLERKANALIMTAAPMLLDALESVVLHFEEWGPIDEHAFEGCLKARVAIKVARGTPLEDWEEHALAEFTRVGRDRRANR